MFTKKMRTPLTDRLLTIILSLAFFLLIGLPFLNHYQEVNHLERTLSNEALAEKEKKLSEIEAILSNINYQQSLAYLSKTGNENRKVQDIYANSPFSLLEEKIAKLKEKKAHLKQTLVEQEQQIQTLIKEIEELKQKQPETQSDPV